MSVLEFIRYFSMFVLLGIAFFYSLLIISEGLFKLNNRIDRLENYNEKIKIERQVKQKRIEDHISAKKTNKI